MHHIEEFQLYRCAYLYSDLIKSLPLDSHQYLPMSCRMSCCRYKRTQPIRRVQIAWPQIQCGGSSTEGSWFASTARGSIALLALTCPRSAPSNWMKKYGKMTDLSRYVLIGRVPPTQRELIINDVSLEK